MLKVETTAGRQSNEISRSIRSKIVTLTHSAKTPHLGSCLSCVDILVAAYSSALNNDTLNPLKPERDRFILSKGHAGLSLYTTLNHFGFISDELLDGYAQPGSPLAEHPIMNPELGIELTTGSLGHGLSVGLGMALASKIGGLKYRVLVLLSDGECNEGSVWEAVMLAPALKLENVCVIVDYNRWQATGRTEEITSIAPLAEKFIAFGWDALDVDGHDLDELCQALEPSTHPSRKPRAIIAHTTKGKGVSFMEDDNNWHYRVPNEEEVCAALSELQEQ